MKNKPCSSTRDANNSFKNINYEEYSKIVASGNPRLRSVSKHHSDADDEGENEKVCCNMTLRDPNYSNKINDCINKHEVELCLKFKDDTYRPIVQADQFLDMIKKKT